jgi:hypothetical protein
MKHDQRSILCWVIIDGEVRNVNDYAGIPPRNRPQALCPLCERPVIMRLGNIRVFHAAHQPGDICSATQPETAKHINAKYYLYSQLKSTKKIVINQKCIGLKEALSVSFATSCPHGNTKPITYIQDWDEVEVERTLSRFRPDITLLRNGEPIGAVEVLVSHSIELNKEEYFEKLSIPWIEVKADDVLPEHGEPWKADCPLPYEKLNNTLIAQQYVCQECQKRLSEYRKEKQKEEIRKQYKITAFRIVDFYYPTSKNFRDIYYFEKREVNGKTVEVRIENEEGNIVDRILNPDTTNTQERLKNAFNKHLEIYKRKGAIVDLPMKWQTWENRIPKVEWKAGDGCFPERYYWSRAEKCWCPIKAWMNVSWDRFWTEKERYLQSLRDKRKYWKNLHPMSISSTYKLPPPPSPVKKKIDVIEEDTLYTFDTVYDGSTQKESEALGTLTNPTASYSQQEVGECIYCHEMTDDWWMIDKGTKKCKCRSCYRKGLSE